MGKGTPFENITLHPDYEWNPSGFGLFYRDIDKPMIQIRDQKSISQLVEKTRYNQQKNSRNEYIMEINVYMGPDSMDSKTCLQKGACIPMGGQSVWSLSGKRDSRPILLVAVALDSISNVYDVYDQGEDSVNAGIRVSVLLSIANALKVNAIPLETASKQLMLAFFEGESWGRVGSRYFLADLANFACLNEVAHSSSPFNDRICASPLRVG